MTSSTADFCRFVTMSDADHVWNDTQCDFGIDGRIEFVAADTQVSELAVATGPQPCGGSIGPLALKPLKRHGTVHDRLGEQV